MFDNREDAGRQLAGRLEGRPLARPLVLAIPRGGVVTGAVIARELGAELDVILSRKLRAPWSPECAIGAVCEDGTYFLNRDVAEVPGLSEAYVEEEVRRQLAEVARRTRLYRSVRAQAPVEGRSVIVTDDGVASGATMTAALRGLQARKPREVIVAVPVAAPEQVERLRCWCDDVVCLREDASLSSVGQYYAHFAPVEDSLAVALLEEANPEQRPQERGRSHGPVGPADGLIEEAAVNEWWTGRYPVR
jgi:putative phosphoribosyl transferase